MVAILNDLRVFVAPLFAHVAELNVVFVVRDATDTWDDVCVSVVVIVDVRADNVSRDSLLLPIGPGNPEEEKEEQASENERHEDAEEQLGFH